jgi:RNA polymerase sigma factor (sigma-70 family)
MHNRAVDLFQSGGTNPTPNVHVNSMGRTTRDTTILENMGLVYHAANEYKRRNTSHDLEDIQQYGMIGLIKAADSFDPDGELPFSTWAGRQIRNAIRDGLGLRRKGRGTVVPATVDPEVLFELISNCPDTDTVGIDLDRQAGLNARESAVVGLVRDGLTVREIAVELDVSPMTVSRAQNAGAAKLRGLGR